MTDKTTLRRVEVLKAMHLIMTHMNNEDAYWNWVVGGVPDCPCEEDYFDIAEDNDLFNDCAECFERNLHRYIKDGIYCG